MDLHIISPEYELTKKIAWIELNTPQGNYIIQQGHIPFIIPLLAHAPLTFQLESGKQQTIEVLDGIAEVTRTQVTVIIRSVPSLKK